MRILSFALRQRLKDWPTSLAFVAVLGAALSLAGAWLSIASPLRQMPYADASRLVAIETMKKGQVGGLNWKDLEDLRTGSVETAAVFLPRTWGLQTEPKGHVEVVLSQQVTGEFFATLGVQPALGDALSRSHEQSGNQHWVWLTHRSWRRLLRGVPDAPGRVIWINAVPHRVAGVLPASFTFPNRGEDADIYLPLNRDEYLGARGAGGLGAIARLRPGASVHQFSEELKASSHALAAQHPGTHAELLFVARDLTSVLMGDRLRLLDWLLAAVGTLVLVAMANASGIWLAQWLKQQRHAAIQLTLGASLRNVVVEQLAQAVVLGIAAAATGIGGAMALLAILRASPLLGPELGRFEVWSPAMLSPPTLLGLSAVALAASLLSAGLPLLTIRARSLAARTATRRSSLRTRLALAVAQLTLTGVLAYTGILVWRNVQALFAADRGFRTDQVLAAGVGIPESKYNSDERMIGFHRRAIEELGRISGVTMAGGGMSLPVTTARTRFLLDDENLPRDEQRAARFSAASAQLLPLLGIPVLRGRGFQPQDRWGTPRVALVNQAFADRYLRDPLGHRLRLSFYNGFAMKPYEEHTIVGVIGNTLNRDLAFETDPQIVISTEQIALEGFTYFLRSSLPADSLRSAVAEAIWRVDPELQRVTPRPLTERVEASILARRTMAWLLSLFGWISVLIVGFGLAASLSATYLEMTRELGIRAALGASPWRLARTAVQWGIVAIAASWVMVLPMSYAISQFIVLDTQPGGWDLSSWLLSGLTLAFVGLAAAYWPARRAVAVNPASTLRAD